MGQVLRGSEIQTCRRVHTCHAPSQAVRRVPNLSVRKQKPREVSSAFRTRDERAPSFGHWTESLRPGQDADLIQEIPTAF